MDVLRTWNIAGHMLRAGLATTEAERRACLRLRYREYHGVQGTVPASIDGLERDWADAHATVLCTTLDGDPRPIGTMRLIDCAHGCLLTHGDGGRPSRFSGERYRLPERCALTQRELDAASSVEGSRYVARVITLDDGLRVIHSNLLLEAATLWCQKQGIRQIVGALREHQYRNLVRERFPVVETHARADGSPHRYHGMDYRVVSMPILAHEPHLRRTLPARDPGLSQVA